MTLAHSFHHCGSDDCPICRGGLSLCEVCGGAEGTLTTDCPGVPLNRIQEEEVAKQSIDFRDGIWIINPFNNYTVDPQTRERRSRRETFLLRALYELNAAAKAVIDEVDDRLNREVPSKYTAPYKSLTNLQITLARLNGMR